MFNFWKTLKKPITVLAPMEDVTDFVFREIISNTAKPDVLFTEFTSVDALFSKGPYAAEGKLKFSPQQHPIVAQIWGTSSELFEKTASYLEDLGFDGIDINMGCPDKNVMKKGAGAALIRNQSLAKELISAVRKGSSKLPISIKIRIDTTSELTKEWISFLLDQDIQVLTIHGRDADSKSNGDANWDEIGKAVTLRNKINPSVLLLGNGDVKSYQEVLDKHKMFKVDGVMIGRGVFHNPFVFKKDYKERKLSKEERIMLLSQHAALFNETWGKTKNFEIMKKFVKVYIKGFRGADRLRSKLMETKHYEEFYSSLNRYH